jgi:hypothetical protein
LKSTKIKQSSFGKHQKLNTPKLNIHILTENHQKIPIYGNANRVAVVTMDKYSIIKKKQRKVLATMNIMRKLTNAKL